MSELAPTGEDNRVVPPDSQQEWPTFSRLAWRLWQRRIPVILGALAVMTASAVLFRLKEKTYRSVAVVSSLGLEPANPLKEVGGEAQGTLPLAGRFLDRMSSSMFAFELVREAASGAGILGKEMSRNSLRDSFSRALWSLGGGSIRSEEEVLARSIVDKLRFERMTFERMDRAPSSENQGGIFRITASYSDPVVARDFLKKVLDLHLSSLQKEEAEVNGRLAKFYDDQIAFLAGQAVGSDSKVDFAANRNRLQKVSRLRAELDAKMQQETSVRAAMESQLGQLREQLAAAEAKYSPTHPEVVALRQTMAESTRNLRGPVDKVAAEIRDLKAKIDGEFADLVGSSLATAEGAGAVGEGHTQYFTKEQTERRSISRLYERMQERYFQAVVQAKLANVMNPDRFRILEEPSLPLRPDTPRLIPWLVATLALAAAAGVVAAILSEILASKADDRWLVSLRTGSRVWSSQAAPPTFVLEPSGLTSDHSARATGFRMPPAPRMVRARSERRNQETAEALAELFAAVAPYRQGDLLHCGFVAISPRTPSSLVAFNMATLTSHRGGLKTLLVCLRHKASLATLLDLPEIRRGEKCSPVPHYGFTLMDIPSPEAIADVETFARTQGFQVILWDLPPSHEMAWFAPRLPRMPLVGVAECGRDHYRTVAAGSLWMRMLQSNCGFQSGIFLTHSSEPRWLKIADSPRRAA